MATTPMTRESLSALYPTLTSVAAHPRLGPDLDAAIAACAVNPEQLWTNYNARAFHLNELVFTICAGPLGSFSDGSAEEMERHLKAVVAAVGLAAARTAFANKLQTANERSILDVRYEIAAAAGAATLMDAGTLKLEAPIGVHAKNSDILGCRNGARTRIEVRVVHNDWPPRVDGAAEATIRDAVCAVGFSAALRFLPDATAADVAKSVIEALATARAHHGDPSVPVSADRFTFWSDESNESFTCADSSCPLTAVTFYPERECRLVVPPVFTQATIDPQERHWIDNPPGVTVFGKDHADPRTYKDAPPSTKLAQAVGSKVRQCEPGACNIVMLGTPSVLIGRDVEDALLGPTAAAIQQGPDGSFGDARLIRKPSGMFVPEAKSEDAESLVKPFKPISAVWHARLGSSAPRSRVYLNPNATVPLRDADATALAASLPDRPD